MTVTTHIHFSLAPFASFDCMEAAEPPGFLEFLMKMKCCSKPHQWKYHTKIINKIIVETSDDIIGSFLYFVTGVNRYNSPESQPTVFLWLKSFSFISSWLVHLQYLSKWSVGLIMCVYVTFEFLCSSWKYRNITYLPHKHKHKVAHNFFMLPLFRSLPHHSPPLWTPLFSLSFNMCPVCTCLGIAEVLLFCAHPPPLSLPLNISGRERRL